MNEIYKAYTYAIVFVVGLDTYKENLMRSFVMVFFLLFCGAGGVQAEEPPVGIVSITFDDATISQYENGLRIAKQYGIRGTLFVGTEGVEKHYTQGGGWAMNWDQVRAFHRSGWEIGSHTHTHSNMTELSSEEIEWELDQSRLLIEREVGVTPVSYASPFGRFNELVVAEVMERYLYHFRSWGGNEGRNDLSDLDHSDLGRDDVGVNESSAEVCGAMLEAGISGQWLVLIFHRVVEDDPDENEVSVHDFHRMMLCARFLEDRSIIQVLPVAEAISANE